MLVMKVCHACDNILGELELEDNLTGEYPDSIMDVVGNVAYSLCPDCMAELEVEPTHRFH